MELAQNSREVIAFSTKNGEYFFNHIPFGFSNVSATCLRLMHELLEGMTFIGVIDIFFLTYLDYILFYWKSENEHSRILTGVFERILKSGLRINPKKC